MTLDAKYDVELDNVESKAINGHNGAKDASRYPFVELGQQFAIIFAGPRRV